MPNPTDHAAAIAALVIKAVDQERRVITDIRGHMRPFAHAAIDRALERMKLQLIQEINATLIDGYEIHPIELEVSAAEATNSDDITKARKELGLE